MKKAQDPLIPGNKEDLCHVTGQVDLAGRAHQVKGSVKHDFLSWRCDLATVNPKCHMNHCNYL